LTLKYNELQVRIAPPAGKSWGGDKIKALSISPHPALSLWRLLDLCRYLCTLNYSA